MNDPVAQSAHAFLRAHTRGELRFDEHIRPLKYVIAPSGELIAPVMVAMLQSMDTVLFVPACEEDALELQVTIEQFREDQPDVLGDVSGGGGGGGGGGALADRWRIHHGDPPDVNWAVLDIDAARFQGMVIDGIALVRRNPLAAEEARICRQMNEDRGDALRALCRRFTSIEVEDPVMVGIDPLGVDVRGRFEIFRIPATERMDTGKDAQRVLHAMIEQARESSEPFLAGETDDA